MHYSLQSEPFHILFRIDGDTTAPMLAHIYTPPVFDDGGYTGIVFATGDCSASANVQKPYTAK